MILSSIQVTLDVRQSIRTLVGFVARRFAMKRRIVRYGFACALGLGLATLPVGMFAADDIKTTDTKTPEKDIPTKAPDFSKYTYVKDVTGEVVKAEDKKLTVKVSWTMLKPGANPKAAPTAVPMSKEYDFTFLPESLVRMQVLPPKLDDKGKKVAYTQKEKDALKLPVGVPNYAASMSDLTKGTPIVVILVRDKSIPASKVTDDDSRIKYVIIQPPPAK